MDDTKETRPSRHSKPGAHMKSQHTQGLHRSAPGPLRLYYGFQFSVFMGFMNVLMSVSLILVPILAVIFLLLSSYSASM